MKFLQLFVIEIFTIKFVKRLLAHPVHHSTSSYKINKTKLMKFVVPGEGWRKFLYDGCKGVADDWIGIDSIDDDGLD